MSELALFGGPKAVTYVGTGLNDGSDMFKWPIVTKEDEDAWNVSYWIPKGVDSGYYAEYEENPVWQYISENYTFNGKKLKLDFLTAPPVPRLKTGTT